MSKKRTEAEPTPAPPPAEPAPTPVEEAPALVEAPAAAPPEPPPAEPAAVEEPAPEAPPPAPRKVWRTVAFARRAARVYLGGALTQVFGGTLITEPDSVARLRGTEGFEFFDLSHPSQLEDLRASHARALAELRCIAEGLGLEVFPHGQVDHKTLRR